MEKQFRIEVASNGLGHFYSVSPLGNSRYEISIEGNILGTIQLDKADHLYCESQGCALDLPLLKAIREAIELQLSMGNKA